MKQLVWIFYLTVCFTMITGCSSNLRNVQTNTVQNSQFSIVSYNTQEFFDAKKDGTEYSDFKKSGDWSSELYKKRLENLCTVIKNLNADIYVFQEIENESVLQDISNFLSGESWNQKDLWNYSCFSKEPGSAIGNAVISRFPLGEMTIHGMDIRSEDSVQPSVRPIMEIEVYFNDKAFTVFVNHWKSKSGGKEETEVWRDWQELVLTEALLNEKKKKGDDFRAVICGDFNRDIFDFKINENPNDGEGNIIFRGKEREIKVRSLWLTPKGKRAFSNGSYFFDGEWESIDHIFIAGNVEFVEFSPQNNGIWVDNEGIPIRYKIYSGQGFSDHLPVKAYISIK